MILPGLETVFQRFIKTVENIIPKKKLSNKKVFSSSSIFTSTLNTTTSSTLNETATTNLNVEHLKERILKQIMKRVSSSGSSESDLTNDKPSLSREEAGIFNYLIIYLKLPTS